VLFRSIDEALVASHTLVVICSPYSARSLWCNKEIEQFKKLGREDRILALIVDGEPNATDQPEHGVPECFPRALRFHVNVRGDYLEERAEPLAADVRPGHLPWQKALVKLVAGITGLSYDDLWQREKRRARRRRLIGAGVGLLLLGAFAGVYWMVEQRHQQRVIANYEQNAKTAEEKRAFSYQAAWLHAAIEAGGDRARLTDQLRDALSRLVLDQMDILPATAGRVESLAFDPEGKLLAVGTSDGLVNLWDVSQSPALLSARFRAGNRGVAHLAFHPRNRVIAVALWDGTIRVWPTDGSARIVSLQGHFPKIRVTYLDFDEDGSHLVSAGDDTFVRIWNTANWQEETPPIAEHGDPVKAAEYSPGGEYVASCDLAGNLRLTRVDSRQTSLQLRSRSKLNRLLISENPPQVLTGGLEGNLQLYHWNGQRLFEIEKAHDNRINDLCWDPSGVSFWSASDDGTVRHWNLQGRLLHSVEQHGPVPGGTSGERLAKILSIARHPANRMLATGGDDGTVKIWRVPAPDLPLKEPMEDDLCKIRLRLVEGEVRGGEAW